MSDTSMGQGWWLASDGRWYPPQSAPGTPPPPPTAYPGGTVAAPGYAYTSTPARGMNGMAIASMVLGILWIYWIGSILALIFGYVALKQIRVRDENGRGFAITGVVLGWVGAGTGILVLILVLIAASSGSGS
jgi:hypothetical protein